MASFSLRRCLRLAAWVLLDFGVLIAAAALSVSADNSGRIRQVKPGTCYCGCAQSKTTGGCTKMCELPKYASHWWAVSCAKPRMKLDKPTENPGAGPHLPHPPKAERASNELSNR